MEVEFNAHKFRELLLYVADRSLEDRRFGATKLNKILFYSDFLAYGLFGQPITGATYQRLSRGPAPRQLVPTQKKLIENQDAVLVERQYFNQKQRRLVALRAPDISLFSAREIDLVDRVIAQYESEDATGITALSHKEMAWRLANDGDELPYELVFLSNRKATANDRERGRALASTHGWTGLV